MELVYSSLIDQLRERLPQINDSQYTDLIGGIEAGPYVVFGVMFNRYLIDLSISDNLQARSGAAKLIEDMALARDERVHDMLSSEVLPTLVRSQTMVDVYWPLLGMDTKRRLKLLKPKFTVNIKLPSSE